MAKCRRTGEVAGAETTTTSPSRHMQRASLASQPPLKRARAAGARGKHLHWPLLAHPIPRRNWEERESKEPKKQNAHVRLLVRRWTDRVDLVVCTGIGDRAPSTQRSRTHTLDRVQLLALGHFKFRSGMRQAWPRLSSLDASWMASSCGNHEFFLLPQGPARQRHRFTVSFTCKFITISIMFVSYDGTLITFDYIVVQRIHEGSVAGSVMNTPYKK